MTVSHVGSFDASRRTWLAPSMLVVRRPRPCTRRKRDAAIRVDVGRGRTRPLPLVSPATRLLALESNATQRPSAQIDGCLSDSCHRLDAAWTHVPPCRRPVCRSRTNTSCWPLCRPPPDCWPGIEPHPAAIRADRRRSWHLFPWPPPSPTLTRVVVPACGRGRRRPCRWCRPSPGSTIEGTPPSGRRRDRGALSPIPAPAEPDAPALRRARLPVADEDVELDVGVARHQIGTRKEGHEATVVADRGGGYRHSPGTCLAPRSRASSSRSAGRDEGHARRACRPGRLCRPGGN